MVSVQIEDRVVELNRKEADEFVQIRKLMEKRKSTEVRRRTAEWIGSAKNAPSVIRRRLALRAIHLDDGEALLTRPSVRA